MRIFEDCGSNMAKEKSKLSNADQTDLLIWYYIFSNIDLWNRLFWGDLWKSYYKSVPSVLKGSHKYTNFQHSRIIFQIFGYHILYATLISKI